MIECMRPLQIRNESDVIHRLTVQRITLEDFTVYSHHYFKTTLQIRLDEKYFRYHLLPVYRITTSL